MIAEGRTVATALCKNCSRSLDLVEWQGYKPEFRYEWLHQGGEKYCDSAPIAEPAPCAEYGECLYKHGADGIHIPDPGWMKR